jgi:glutathione synthase/RimK-type ligase-like ATP-grasp enzyme
MRSSCQKIKTTNKKLNTFSKRYLETIITSIAKKENIEVSFLCNNWVIRLTKDGITKNIFGYNFGLNSSTSKMICDDKYACSTILQQAGIPYVKCKFFDILHSDRQAMIYEIFEYLNIYEDGIVCKDNMGTGGKHVYLCYTKKDVLLAIDKFANHNINFIVNPFLDISSEYRVIILDGEVLLTYKKIPKIVIGNGESTILELIKNVSKLTDKQIRNCLIPESLPNDIPMFGEQITYSWKNNLQYGANVSLVIEDKKIIENIALQATQEIGIRLAAVDIVKIKYVGKYNIKDYRILEINSGIMMENLFQLGYKKIVRSIYHKIINRMFD